MLEQNTTRRLLWFSILFAFGVCVVSPAISSAQNPDVVILNRKDSDQTTKRTGEIVQWEGLSLTLRSNGRDREIDNDQIVSIETSWPDDYQKGINALAQGNATAAISLLGSALTNEDRLWAQHIIRSKLVIAYEAVDQSASAAKHFFEILKEDRNTRFLGLAPLNWTGSGTGLTQQSRTWIQSSDPTAKLVAASWLLSSPDREQAIATLEKLTQSIQPRIKHLAIAQLWRTRTKANSKQIKVWVGLVQKMPSSLRAGPYFVIGESQSRAGETDKAVINYLKARILFPENQTLAAAALYRSATLLNNKGQTKEARSLLNELVANYPQTLWAKQANQ